jgi:hypothetical protein
MGKQGQKVGAQRGNRQRRSPSPCSSSARNIRRSWRVGAQHRSKSSCAASSTGQTVCLTRATMEYVGQSSVRSVPPRQTRTVVVRGALLPAFWGTFLGGPVLCATGAASAALNGGFAGQRLEPILSQVAGNGYQVGKPATPLSVVTAGHLEGRDVIEELMRWPAGARA